MKTSVIISTYNSPDWLQKVIWGYENQHDADFEIIIADDGSSGENLAANKEMIANAGLNINHVWQEDDGFQKCRILNKAILASSGDYLIFSDGDCIPHPGFVAAHKSNARTGQYLSGGYSKLPMELSKRLDHEDIASGKAFRPLWLLQNGLPVSGSWFKIACKSWGLDALMNRMTTAKRTFNGNNSSCFKTDCLAVNGFDETMHYGGEDREFGYRLENAGIKPSGFRYSAPCLHLDHARGYVQEELRAKNREIIRKTRTTGRVETDNGLKKIRHQG